MSPLNTSNYDINIDYLDNQIVKLISERSRYVEQAAKFKKDTEDVKAPKRVEAVIKKVRTIADENNVNPDIIEKVYRTMISCFINHELIHHSKIDNI
ncbi:chorismate mutase [Bacillus sp. FSL K6-3431]|uniref:chorismate mutase n=1 Tax=Bacillus sp. FSL K6-3431 TaxID=2921500 RepID=UPI0030FB5DA0